MFGDFQVALFSIVDTVSESVSNPPLWAIIVVLGAILLVAGVITYFLSKKLFGKNKRNNDAGSENNDDIENNGSVE